MLPSAVRALVTSGIFASVIGAFGGTTTTGRGGIGGGAIPRTDGIIRARRGGIAVLG